MGNPYKTIDNHVHIAGRGDVYPDDLYWSKLFEEGIGFQALKILKGWGCKKVGDQLMIDTLRKQINEANSIDYAVVLAFDNVYDVDGTYRGPKQTGAGQIRSNLFVSNKFVLDLCQATPKLLPGISVHPFRENALRELDNYEDKAVLCKWMPSAHLIDFDNPRAQPKLEKFYIKMAEIQLPLLLHTGVEASIPSSDKRYNKYNNPAYIEKALDMGVTVILAHCGCSYFDLLEDNFVNEALKMFEKQQTVKPSWRLYADISALFSPFRKRKILDRIFKSIPASQLIYGSDFPNPAKGRREFFLRAFLRFRKANLLNRYFNITSKWLPEYYSQSDTFLILTNFHRLLDKLGRDHLVVPS
jgi:predicted TIM-barrel fold metal-dependent hydrolase